MTTANRKFGVFSSSEDPQKLADTVKGFIILISSLIILVAHSLGINIGTAQITEFAIGAGTATSSIMIGYGLIKKFVVWAIAKWHTKGTDQVDTPVDPIDPTMQEG